MNSENSIFKQIDGVGNYTYSFNTPIQLPSNCEMLISVTDATFPNVIPNVTSSNNKISFYVPIFLSIQDNEVFFRAPCRKFNIPLSQLDEAVKDQLI